MSRVKKKYPDRINVFLGSDEDVRRRIHSIPSGIRSSMIRNLLDKAVKTQQSDPLIYGAILSGQFDIKYKHLVLPEGNPVEEEIRKTLVDMLDDETT
jgi:hypothetical protein